METAAVAQETPTAHTKHASELVGSHESIYATDSGAAYGADSLDIMRDMPPNCVKAVITSPPYALQFQKEYGNIGKDGYIQWFLPFATEIKRILTTDGSFVVNVGGSYNAGLPTRSLYHFKMLIALCEEVGFHLAQELFWYNPARLPAPAEWVNVRRIRIKDSVEYIWWLSPSPWPDADNRRVLQPYSSDMIRLLDKGYLAKNRPSGHNISPNFRKNGGGSIPPNLITCGNNESNSSYLRACQELGLRVHPARFPSGLPKFFISLLTQPGDIVLDPFAGSNTTGCVAEDLTRRWVAIEIELDYIRSSCVRFGLDPREL